MPRPDVDLLDAMRSIRVAQGSLQGWSAEAERLVTDKAFVGSATDARRSLIDASRLLRQHVEAAQQVGTLDHRISHFYPYPIAFRWRVARDAEGSSNVELAYAAVLDCFETTMAFSAAIALAYARDNQIEVSAMKEVRRKLTSSARGVSLGDWINILAEVSGSRVFAKIDQNRPLSSIRGMLPPGSDRAFAQQRLSGRRNDQSHQRRVDISDLPDAISRAKRDLALLLDGAEFLGDIRVFQIKSAKWDSLDLCGRASAVLLRGDHPIGSTEQFNHDQPDVECDSLYARDEGGRLILLRPFLTRSECPQCRSWSTFHPDRRDGGKIMLKALDHSHVIDGSSVESALRRVGYVGAPVGEA